MVGAGARFARWVGNVLIKSRWDVRRRRGSKLKCFHLFSYGCTNLLLTFRWRYGTQVSRFLSYLQWGGVRPLTFAVSDDPVECEHILVAIIFYNFDSIGWCTVFTFCSPPFAIYEPRHSKLVLTFQLPAMAAQLIALWYTPLRPGGLGFSLDTALPTCNTALNTRKKGGNCRFYFETFLAGCRPASTINLSM